MPFSKNFAPSLTQNQLRHCKLNTYMYGINFTSHKQYLFGFLFSIETKKSRTDLSGLNIFLHYVCY